jgi:hypothetical protein
MCKNKDNPRIDRVDGDERGWYICFENLKYLNKDRSITSGVKSTEESFWPTKEAAKNFLAFWRSEMEKEKAGLRPVIVKNKQQKDVKEIPGWFHQWGQYGDADETELMGVVEFSNGECDYFPVDCIRFTDR